MAYIQIVYIAQQHHLLRQLFQGCLEPLSITFPHMAKDRTVRRVTPYIFLVEVYTHLMLDENLVSQISVRIQEGSVKSYAQISLQAPENSVSRWQRCPG